MHKKGISLFPVELFSSQTAKRFRKEPFNVSEKFGYRKFLCVRKGYHCFPSEKVCPTVPKNFVRNPSVFQKTSGIEKNKDDREAGIVADHAVVGEKKD